MQCHIRFIAVKEAIGFDGQQDLQTKVMLALFGLFAEVESELISERKSAGMAAAQAKGKLVARPRGFLGKSKLRQGGGNPAVSWKAGLQGGDRQDFGHLQNHLHHFIRTRRLDAPDSKGSASKARL